MEVFLFPLVNVTLFPGTTKPLNVFEPRYIAMVRDAIRTKTPIAIGFIEDVNHVSPVRPGEVVPFVRRVAGFGYAQIIEERPNGTLVIFIQASGKVRLGPVLDRNEPYLVCEAELIIEDTQLSPELNDDFGALYKILARWLQTHVPDAAQRDLFMRNLRLPEEVVGSFASYLVRDYDMQQIVLELNQMDDKVRFLHRLMESSELTL